MSKDSKNEAHQQQYGTFQGSPAMGFPQPVPPPGFSASSAPPQPPYYPIAHAYQAVPGDISRGGYAPVVEGTPVRPHRLPCCGIGIGWLLFILGFFIAALPWYLGACIILCARVDAREKPGLVACTIAAVIATIAAIFGATKDVW